MTTSKTPTVARRSTKAPSQPAVAVPKQPAPKKTAVASAVVPQPKAPKAAEQRPPKVKMVRDSFTFPEAEHKRLVELKKRLIALGTEVKKGELVRAGLGLLAALDNAKLVKAVSGVDKLKTGRPKK